MSFSSMYVVLYVALVLDGFPGFTHLSFGLVLNVQIEIGSEIIVHFGKNVCYKKNVLIKINLFDWSYMFEHGELGF